ncbi:MAG: endolytic transglycosylase MltG [Chloroflexi bacterium]|nr:MAG: endolytic transglycosylase MltG [Chloroflexota bacterium]
MTSIKNKWGKRFMLVIIMILFLIALCLFGGIAASIPARTAQQFGQADPDLPALKLYQQSIILLLSGEEILITGNQTEEEIYFLISPGDSLETITAGLKDVGLVQHDQAFRAYLIYSGIDRRIQPGDYFFSPQLSEMEIAQALGNSPGTTSVSILAGWRVEEIGEKLSGAGLQINPDKFVQMVMADGKEGYLSPGIYPVDREISAEALVEMFYQRFLSQVTPALESQLADQGLTLHEAVILASIVERETVIEEEMPLIASVFLNRLANNMNLAADPTIQYALGFNREQGTWWTNPLSLEDLKLPSSYNTYENPGLPPGPICNPGLAAIQAVANPAQTSFLYFRADCSGSGHHVFSESFQEHLENACP